MSDHRAVATVTAALQGVLQGPLGQAVTSAGVSFSRPDATNLQTPQVNIFLYQVTPSAAHRNADVPNRRADGSLSRRPHVALDLHYLFTFHGSDANLEPQRLLGALMTTLQNQPLLSSQDITYAVNQYGFLKGSGLENQVERVRFTPLALSLEEFSKLWSVFFQVEYSLSVAYQASVVLMESDVTAQEALPVLHPRLHVMPFNVPSISQVFAQAGAQRPILPGGTLVIQGRHLLGQSTLVLLGGQERTPLSVSDSQITLAIPPDLLAGVQGVQVLQKTLMGSPRTPHRGFESNVAAFVLRPILSAPAAVLDSNSSAAVKLTDVTLNVVPHIGPGQRAILLLNSLPADPPAAYTSLTTVQAADSGQVTLQFENVPSGTYLARLQIDGAESPLTVDPATGQYNGPTVSMP
jgi:hypothetical protein